MFKETMCNVCVAPTDNNVGRAVQTDPTFAWSTMTNNVASVCTKLTKTTDLCDRN